KGRERLRRRHDRELSCSDGGRRLASRNISTRERRMRNFIAMMGAGLGLAAAGAADAAPSIHIRDAAARVTVIPEARADILVTVVRPNGRLPLQVSRFGERVTVRGNVAHRVHGCRTLMGRRTIDIRGVGLVDYDELPQIV